MQFGVKSKNANENQHYSKLSSKDVNREIGLFRLTYQLQGCKMCWPLLLLLAILSFSLAVNC